MPIPTSIDESVIEALTNRPWAKIFAFFGSRGMTPLKIKEQGFTPSKVSTIQEKLRINGKYEEFFTSQGSERYVLNDRGRGMQSTARYFLATEQELCHSYGDDDYFVLFNGTDGRGALNTLEAIFESGATKISDLDPSLCGEPLKRRMQRFKELGIVTYEGRTLNSRNELTVTDKGKDVYEKLIKPFIGAVSITPGLVKLKKTGDYSWGKRKSAIREYNPSSA